MRKYLQLLKKVLIGIFLVIYFIVVISISILLLNENDYGATQFGDKVLIFIDKENVTKGYKEGSLVLVQNKKLDSFSPGDEIFIYKTDNNGEISYLISRVEIVNTQVDSPYIALINDGGFWGEDFIIGTAYKTYEKLGGILSFLEKKWIFFTILIVPCFFILIYEVYLIIIYIKFGDSQSDEEVAESTPSIEVNVPPVTQVPAVGDFTQNPTVQPQVVPNVVYQTMPSQVQPQPQYAAQPVQMVQPQYVNPAVQSTQMAQPQYVAQPVQMVQPQQYQQSQVVQPQYVNPAVQPPQMTQPQYVAQPVQMVQPQVQYQQSQVVQNQTIENQQNPNNFNY